MSSYWAGNLARKLAHPETEKLAHPEGWQSSLQRTSLQEDTPPGGHASRRTRLQEDRPPGGQASRRTGLQEDTPPGGHASRGTRLQADTPPGQTLLQEDINPVGKFHRCLLSDIPPAEGLQEDSSPAQRLQADMPPGGQASRRTGLQADMLPAEKCSSL